MARTKNIVRPVVKTLSFREDTIGQVEAMLIDPLTGELPYGAVSKFLQELVEDYLLRQRYKKEYEAQIVIDEFAISDLNEAELRKLGYKVKRF